MLHVDASLHSFTEPITFVLLDFTFYFLGPSFQLVFLHLIYLAISSFLAQHSPYITVPRVSSKGKFFAVTSVIKTKYKRGLRTESQSSQSSALHHHTHCQIHYNQPYTTLAFLQNTIQSLLKSHHDEIEKLNYPK